MFDYMLFAIFPYIAVILAVVVGLYRFITDRFSYSSFSSQFFENRVLFWGSVIWHYSILLIILSHLFVLLFPDTWALVISTPIRLYIMEITGLVLGVLTIFGLVLLILRRIRDSKLSVVTTIMDWTLLTVLLAQVVLGVWVAFFYRWGANWAPHTAVPWLISLFKLNPQIQFIQAMPWVIKLHMLNAFVIVGLFPFTRLVHLVTYPFSYLWRPNQLVIWNRDPKRSA